MFGGSGAVPARSPGRPRALPRLEQRPRANAEGLEPRAALLGGVDVRVRCRRRDRRRARPPSTRRPRGRFQSATGARRRDRPRTSEGVEEGGHRLPMTRCWPHLIRPLDACCAPHAAEARLAVKSRPPTVGTVAFGRKPRPVVTLVSRVSLAPKIVVVDSSSACGANFESPPPRRPLRPDKMAEEAAADGKASHARRLDPKARRKRPRARDPRPPCFRRPRDSL